MENVGRVLVFEDLKLNEVLTILNHLRGDVGAEPIKKGKVPITQ